MRCYCATADFLAAASGNTKDTDERTNGRHGVDVCTSSVTEHASAARAAHLVKFGMPIHTLHELFQAETAVRTVPCRSCTPVRSGGLTRQQKKAHSPLVRGAVASSGTMVYCAVRCATGTRATTIPTVVMTKDTGEHTLQLPAAGARSATYLMWKSCNARARCSRNGSLCGCQSSQRSFFFGLGAPALRRIVRIMWANSMGSRYLRHGKE